MMTNEEMMAEARAAARSISRAVSTRQRIFMPADQLEILLMDAYAKGITAQSRRAVQQFAPQMMSKYDQLARS